MDIVINRLIESKRNLALFSISSLLLWGMPRRKKSPVAEYLSSIGRKGGAKKVPKGLALVSPEDRAKIREKGLAARRAKAGSKNNVAEKRSAS